MGVHIILHFILNLKREQFYKNFFKKLKIFLWKTSKINKILKLKIAKADENLNVGKDGIDGQRFCRKDVTHFHFIAKLMMHKSLKNDL